MKKLIIIVLLLLLITGSFDFSLEYGYYQILRWLVFICSGMIAYKNFNVNKGIFSIFCFITILFNPIIPIYFSKDTWRIIDIITGLGFLTYIWKGNLK